MQDNQSYPTMPVLFKQSQFRQYRLRLSGNTFFKIKEKIYNPEQLKAILDKLRPTDTYQTVSMWLNPAFLGAKNITKPKYPLPRHLLYQRTESRINAILDNLFLSSNYLMDFDLKDYKDSSEMLSNVSLARLFLQEHGMKDQLLMKTPSGGRQLLVMDFDKWANIHIANPRDREYAYSRKMKVLTDMLIKANIHWDDKVSLNTRAVFRTANTIGGLYKNKVQLIDFKNEQVIFAK